MSDPPNNDAPAPSPAAPADARLQRALELEADTEALDELPHEYSALARAVANDVHVLNGELIALRRERDEALKRLQFQDKWLSDGVYFTTAEYKAEVAKHQEVEKECDALREACAKEDAAIQQVLGRALGYPRYCDDQKNFPGATEANGVCVGEHVAASLVTEAAAKIDVLREALRNLLLQLARMPDKDLPTEVHMAIMGCGIALALAAPKEST
jgi:hypothetical protein